MISGPDLGYQMRLDPKYTSVDTIRRLSTSNLSDVEKIYRSRSFITLLQPQDMPFKVKGKGVTNEDEKRSALSLAQAKASAMSVKSQSASPSVRSTKSSARRGRGKNKFTPRESNVKPTESQRIIVNQFPTNETKLPQIKVNEKIDGKGNSSTGKHKMPTSDKNVGSWTLSYINQSLLEIDMSDFAPFGEYGYFSAYGVKGHQAYTTSEKIANVNSMQSVNRLTMNLQLQGKLYKSRLGPEYDNRATTSGLSRSKFQNSFSRSKSLSDFSTDTKILKRIFEGKQVKQSQVGTKQKSSTLNLSRSKTCLFTPTDTQRGRSTKKKRGTREITLSKGNLGSNESLTSQEEKQAVKPVMKTTSTQTNYEEASFYSNNLNENVYVTKETSLSKDKHNQVGILYSPACFDPILSYDNPLQSLNSLKYLEKTLLQNATHRIAKDTIVEDLESMYSDEPERLDFEVSIARNRCNQGT